MKKIILLLLIVSLSSFRNVSQTTASNDKFEFTFWQYSTYSDWSGYLFYVNNFTNEYGTVTIELTEIGIVETFEVLPNSSNAFLVGHNPNDFNYARFVPNMKVIATFTTSSFTSKLRVRIGNTW